MFDPTPTEAALGSIDTKNPSVFEDQAGVSGNPGSARPCHRIEPIAAVGEVIAGATSVCRVIDLFQGRPRGKPGIWFAADSGLSSPVGTKPFLQTAAKLLMVNHLPG
jgi:hypothetical protein